MMGQQCLKREKSVNRELIFFVRPCLVNDFASTYADVAGAGIRSIVLAAKMGNIDFLNAGDAARAKDVLRGLNLTSPACHGFHSEHYDLNEPDDALWERMIEMHSQLIQSTAEFGCRTYVCHPGESPKNNSRLLSWKRVRSTLDRLAPKARSCGITIALENSLPGCLGADASELLAFVKEYDCSTVQICYDSGHAHIAEDAAAVLKKLAPHVVTVHLHDNDRISDHHFIPGHGTIAWGKVVKLLEDCPSLLHIETEAFNTEHWPRAKVYQRYQDVLHC